MCHRRWTGAKAVRVFGRRRGQSGGIRPNLRPNLRHDPFYDIDRNAWIELPDTTAPHHNYPALWCNEQTTGEQVLYIAGDHSKELGLTECLDLRESTKRWRVAPRYDQIHKYVMEPVDEDMISVVETRRVFI